MHNQMFSIVLIKVEILTRLQRSGKYLEPKQFDGAVLQSKSESHEPKFWIAGNALEYSQLLSCSSCSTMLENGTK